MRLTAVVALLLWACAPALAQEAEYVPPTERYEIPWGATPAKVVEEFRREPDFEGPGSSLTYVGAGGGQAVFVFARDALWVVGRTVRNPAIASENPTRDATRAVSTCLELWLV